MVAVATSDLFTCGDNGRGKFILLYMLAYAFTVPITFLTSDFGDELVVHFGCCCTCVAQRLPLDRTLAACVGMPLLLSA
jgi:hypothetical protein